jgi:hypothetical protein
MDFFSTCPLTGLPIQGLATTKAPSSSALVLYAFEPIGCALFEFNTALSVAQMINQGSFKPRTDLAGLCREAAEMNQPPPIISNEIFGEQRKDAPNTFDGKRTHFLRLLHDTGGNEYIERQINTLRDFPLAYAASAEEFHRILKSLLADNLIQYNEGSVVRGDWVNGIQAHYQGMLLTPAGKQFVTLFYSPPTLPTKMPPTSTFNFGNGTHFFQVQGDNAVQTGVTGASASANVASGNNNTQSNQAGQVASLPELIELVKQALRSTAFDSNREEINDEVKRIEVQLEKPEPKKGIIKRAFDSLQDLAADSAGAVGAHTVVELIKHVPALLAAAGIN